jgi:hypothetical protein
MRHPVRVLCEGFRDNLDTPVKRQSSCPSTDTRHAAPRFSLAGAIHRAIRMGPKRNLRDLYAQRTAGTENHESEKIMPRTALRLRGQGWLGRGVGARAGLMPELNPRRAVPAELRSPFTPPVRRSSRLDSQPRDSRVHGCVAMRRECLRNRKCTRSFCEFGVTPQSPRAHAKQRPPVRD